MSSYLSLFNYQIFLPNGFNAETTPIGFTEFEDSKTAKQIKIWVFLHGLMGYGQNWRRIAQQISEQTDSWNFVFTFDQRGHGKSFQPITGFAPDDYAEDLALILEELKQKDPVWGNKIILVGHSMGGRNALAFASKFPEKLEKLIIVDIGPDSRPEAPNYYQNLLDLVPTPFANKLMAKEFFMNQFAVLAKNYKQPQTLGAYLYSNIQEDSKSGLCDWRFSKAAMIQSVVQGRAQDHWPYLRGLTMPTLVIRGGSSEDLTLDEFRRMCLANPRIHGVEIPEAGHWVHFDKPKEFLKELLEFAKSS